MKTSTDDLFKGTIKERKLAALLCVIQDATSSYMLMNNIHIISCDKILSVLRTQGIEGWDDFLKMVEDKISILGR